MGHKDLRFGKIVHILLVFYNIHFLGFFHWTVSNLFLCSVTVNTIYRFSQTYNLYNKEASVCFLIIKVANEL